MEYELTPVKQYNTTRKGGKDSKMSNKKQEVPTAKIRKAYTPSRMEVAKTVIIAVLITAAISFIAGVNYQQGQEAEIRQAVQAAQPAPASK